MLLGVMEPRLLCSPRSRLMQLQHFGFLSLEACIKLTLHLLANLPLAQRDTAASEGIKGRGRGVPSYHCSWVRGAGTSACWSRAAGTVDFPFELRLTDLLDDVGVETLAAEEVAIHRLAERAVKDRQVLAAD